MNVNKSVYVAFIASVAALGGFLFGFDTAVISGALSPLITYFNLEAQPAMQGWLVSSVLLGCVFGALGSGYLADKYGRKCALLWAGGLFLVSSIGSATAVTFFFFIICRLTAGLAVGIAAMVSPLYIAEISPVNIRGRMVALYQFAITIGVLIAFFSNNFLRDLAGRFEGMGPDSWSSVEIWRMMLGVAVIPSGLFLLLLLFVPESPRFYMLREKLQQARQTLLRINKPAVADSEMDSISRSLRTEKVSLKKLFHGPLRKATFIALYLSIVSQLSGIDIVLHYGPVILERAGFTFADSLSGQIVFGSVLVIFTLLAMWKVDSLGRKPLLFIGNAGIFLSLVLIGFLFNTDGSSDLALVVSVSFFVASFALSLGPIPWIVMSEIFPITIRGKAMAISTFALFGSTWLVAQLFPISISWLGEQKTFWLLALFTLPTFLFLWKVLPETKGRSLEDNKEL